MSLYEVENSSFININGIALHIAIVASGVEADDTLSAEAAVQACFPKVNLQVDGFITTETVEEDQEEDFDDEDDDEDDDEEEDEEEDEDEEDEDF